MMTDRASRLNGKCKFSRAAATTTVVSKYLHSARNKLASHYGHQRSGVAGETRLLTCLHRLNEIFCTEVLMPRVQLT